MNNRSSLAGTLQVITSNVRTRNTFLYDKNAKYSPSMVTKRAYKVRDDGFADSQRLIYQDYKVSNTEGYDKVCASRQFTMACNVSYDNQRRIVASNKDGHLATTSSTGETDKHSTHTHTHSEPCTVRSSLCQPHNVHGLIISCNNDAKKH